MYCIMKTLNITIKDGRSIVRKVDSYRETLRNLEDWDQYLLDESCLPGPRANLELVEAVAEEGNLERFKRYLTLDSERAPAGSVDEFLAVCGVVGLGKLIAEGNKEFIYTLRISASDARWRVREAVAIALQRFGVSDLDGLLCEMIEWSKGSLLEKRAVVAAICEPKLLKQPKEIEKVMKLLDNITHDLLSEENRKSEELRILRKALGYGWSVAVIADPDKGKVLMEKWFTNEDKDIQWIMKENIKKDRLKKMDLDWTLSWKLKLGLN